MNMMKFGKAHMAFMVLRSDEDQHLSIKWYSEDGQLLTESQVVIKADEDYVLSPYKDSDHFSMIQRRMTYATGQAGSPEATTVSKPAEGEPDQR